MYEADIRKAVEMKLAGPCDGECEDICTCNAVTCKRILRLIKDLWEHHVAYPANETIENVIDAMMEEGLVAVFTGCPIECFDEEHDFDVNQGCCPTPCKSYRWCGNEAHLLHGTRCEHVAQEPSRAAGMQCALGAGHDGAHVWGGEDYGDGLVVNPKWSPERPRVDWDWRPQGERLKQDKRGYSPRQTVGEYEAFYDDKEVLPRYDHDTRCYVRDDLPAMFDCGCSRNKVLIGKCGVYGRDGRPRGWRGGPDLEPVPAP